MDQALLAAAVCFASGFIVGYLFRDGISRKRRAKAKRNRRFFYEAALATDNIENLSVKAKTADPLETASLDILGQATAASKRPIMSFQRGAAVAVPSAPSAMV